MQAMQFLQMQQQQLQAIQQQVQGASSPWNIGMYFPRLKSFTMELHMLSPGAAYRVPDSNINLSGSYQQVNQINPF
jgi:hypothetical protein